MALFPRWANTVPTVLAGASFGGVVVTIGLVWYYFTPNFWEVGYMPEQPGTGFNHQIHAGKLGIDCRYCHTKVEKSPEANVPNVATCYGCHGENRLDTRYVADERVQFVRAAYTAGARYDEVAALRARGEYEAARATLEQYEAEGLPVVEGGAPIAWRRVHKLPDYVRNFPHHVHVEAGVSCYSCHGQIMGMPVVYQAESLSMAWCLDCHRNPEASMVPREKVTDLRWVEHELEERAAGYSEVDVDALLESLRRKPPEHCAACHH